MICLDKNIRNPLRRDGTSQAQRQAAALVDGYVLIDERSEADMISYAHELAKLFQYYDFKNLPFSDWTAFFSQQTTEEQPHYTLFKTFLHIFKQAQEHLNTLTQRHLEYYYQEVLQLDKKAAIPDEVFVIFELAKNVNQYLIEEGIYLNGGKDESGVEQWYKTNESLVANKVKVKEVKSIYHHYREITDPITEEVTVIQNYLYKDADTMSQDYSGLDQEIEKIETVKFYKTDCENRDVDEKPITICNNDEGILGDFTASVPAYWKPFGKNQRKESAANRLMEDVELGFALSSPLLLMESGKRTITWHIKFAEVHPEFANLTEEAIKSFIAIFINGEKEWIDLTSYECRCSQYFGFLHFTIVIPAEVEPIRGYDSEVFTEAYDTEWPVLKMVFKNNEHAHLYQVFSECLVSLNNIQVKVEDIKDLVLQTDTSLLDPTKAFQPFGSLPENGTSFYAGYPEAFQKPLKRFSFTLEWDKLPSTDLGTHYGSYPWSINNRSFRCKAHLLHNNVFVEKSGTIKTSYLFDGLNVKEKQILSYTPSSFVGQYERTLSKKTFKKFDYSLKNGFVRFDLETVANVSNSNTISNLGLQLSGFAHKAYPRLYTDAVIKKASEINSGSTQITTNENGTLAFNNTFGVASSTTKLPKEPYTPTLKSFSMSYEAQQHFFARASKDEGVERFYHIHPFGVEEKFGNNSAQNKFPLIPNYPANGYMYIGLEELVPASIVTLYFQIAEGTADPALDFEKEELTFSILINNEWKKLTATQVLSDSTGSLQYTGIIKLNIPKDATKNNTILTAGLHWIQVDFPYKEREARRAGGFPGILGLKTQAVSATFEDRGNAKSHYEQALAADSITKLVRKNTAVKKLEQPFSSLKGRPEESNANFFVRSSERLRHKQRSINIWDYERMVLEQFPSIYKVKCLNHSSDLSDIAPGDVYLIVISDRRNSNVGNPLQPLTSVRIMAAIVTYLKKYTTPFLKLDVANPIYEQVKVTFDVGFYVGFDEGYYKKELNKEIVRYLAPWSYDSGEDIIFGGKIYASSILAFIEKRDYVDYVTNFRMFHIYDSEGIGCMTICKDFVVAGGFVEAEVDIAIAQTARSVLTSAPIHCINTLTPGKYECHHENPEIEEI